MEACPPTTGYRLRKFAKKNRATLATAGIFAFTLALFSALCIWFAIDSINAQHGAAVAQVLAEQERDRANAAATKAKLAAESEARAKLDALEKEKLAVEQRARAEKARDRTRDVLDAMTSAVTGDSLTTQKEINPEQKKFLTEVLTYYREFAGEKADDEQTRRVAQAAYRVGYIEVRLGRKEQASRGISDGSGRLSEACCRLSCPARLPARTGPQPQQPRGGCWAIWGSARRRASSTARRWPSRRSWLPTSPRCPTIGRNWPAATTTWGSYWTNLGKSNGGGGASPPGTVYPGEIGRRLPRRAQLPAGAGPAATTPWGSC